MDEMYRLVRNGPYVYPGANAIKQKNGSTKTLKYVDIQNLVLQEGDIIIAISLMVILYFLIANHLCIK